MKKKRVFVSLIASALSLAMLLSACSGTANSSASSSTTSSDSSSTSAVTKDGKDKDGNIVDLNAYASSLGDQWFTEEDEEIWSHIEDKSSNPDKIVWRHGAPNRSLDQSPDLRSHKRFFIELKKALGDRVEFQFYLNGTLGTSTDQILGGLQAQNFESYGYNVGAFFEYTKAFTPLDVGFLIPDTKAGIAVTAYDSPAAQIMKERCIKDCGLNVLIMGAIGMRQITNNKHAITTLDDIKSLKIRTQSNTLHMALFEALGASPTPISFAELFTALQQKTVDGEENPIANIFEQNYAEVQSYLTMSNHLYTAGAFVVNNDWLKSLPEDVQQAVDNAAKIAQEQSGKDLLSSEAEMLNYLSTRMQVDTLTEDAKAKFKNRAESMWDQAGDVMGDEYWNQVKTAIEGVINNM